MTSWIVEVTRTVRLELPADDAEGAKVAGLDAAWEWCPETAHRGDQGSAVARVVRAGDLPGGTLAPPVAEIEGTP